MRFRVRRREKAVYEEPGTDPAQYLKPERLVPAGGRFHEIAAKVLEGKNGEMVRARARAEACGLQLAGQDQQGGRVLDSSIIPIS